MKKTVFFLAALMCCFGLFAQEIDAENINDRIPVRVGVLNGPSCIPAAYLMENPEEREGISLSFDVYANPQALLPKLLKNEVDVGFLPLNVAAKVYNSANKAILCAAISGNGNLSLITKDKDIKKITDLAGKTVYVAGQGATPEYIFRYVLSQYDLDLPVTLDYSIPTANLPAALISNQIEYAVVPEPFATIASMKDKSIKSAIDLQKEYRVLSSTKTYPLTCIVVTSKFYKQNPDAVRMFMDAYEFSLMWTIDNPGTAGKYCEENGLGLSAAVVKKAIGKSNYVYIPAAQEIKPIEEMLKIFMQNDESSVGGKLPEHDFYLEYVH